jgi:hypothetical protein
MQDINQRVIQFEKELDSMLQKYHLVMNIAPKFPTNELPTLVSTAVDVINSYGVVYKPVYSEKKD